MATPDGRQLENNHRCQVYPIDKMNIKVFEEVLWLKKLLAKSVDTNTKGGYSPNV
jgi:hypothetical protein